MLKNFIADTGLIDFVASFRLFCLLKLEQRTISELGRSRIVHCVKTYLPGSNLVQFCYLNYRDGTFRKGYSNFGPTNEKLAKNVRKMLHLFCIPFVNLKELFSLKYARVTHLPMDTTLMHRAHFSLATSCSVRHLTAHISSHAPLCVQLRSLPRLRVLCGARTALVLRLLVLGCRCHLRSRRRLLCLLACSCHLCLPSLGLFGRGFLSGLTELDLLSLLPLQVVQAHTHYCFLELGRLCFLAPILVLDLTLLVLTTPGLGPGQLHGLDALVEHGCCLTGNEQVGLTIFGNKPDAASWVDFVLSVLADFRLDNHGESEKGRAA